MTSVGHVLVDWSELDPTLQEFLQDHTTKITELQTYAHTAAARIVTLETQLADALNKLNAIHTAPHGTHNSGNDIIKFINQSSFLGKIVPKPFDNKTSCEIWAEDFKTDISGQLYELLELLASAELSDFNRADVINNASIGPEAARILDNRLFHFLHKFVYTPRSFKQPVIHSTAGWVLISGATKRCCQETTDE